MTRNDSIQNTLLGLFTFFACLFVLSIIATQYWDISLLKLYKTFTTHLYKPHYNKVTSHPIVPRMYYTFIIFATVTSWIIVTLLSLIHKKNLNMRLTPAIWICAIILFTVFQQSKRIEYTQKEYKRFAHKTENERKLELFKSIYLFSMISSDIIIGNNHLGEMRSDINLHDDPYPVMTFLLRYHLYPKVIFPIRPPSNNKNIIIFINEHDNIIVPENFKIIYQTPNKGLVLAVNKESIE